MFYLNDNIIYTLKKILGVIKLNSKKMKINKKINLFYSSVINYCGQSGAVESVGQSALANSPECLLIPSAGCPLS